MILINIYSALIVLLVIFFFSCIFIVHTSSLNIMFSYRQLERDVERQVSILVTWVEVK